MPTESDFWPIKTDQSEALKLTPSASPDLHNSSVFPVSVRSFNYLDQRIQCFEILILLLASKSIDDEMLTIYFIRYFLFYLCLFSLCLFLEMRLAHFVFTISGL